MSRPRLLIVISLFGVAALVMFAAPASASSQAYRAWFTSTDKGWQGTRATVNNPAGSQENVVSGDFAHTTVYAGNNLTGSNASIIQHGVHWRNQDPEDYCNENTLAYFTEVEHTGVYTCYTDGTAQTTDSHLDTVKLSVGIWKSYTDGIWDNISTSWTACGGDACTLAAFGEEGDFAAGTFWYAKFAGTTPWEFYNGTLWNTINTCDSSCLSTPPPWRTSGPFPGGIWSLIYND
jgi:hypothetical protein